MPRAIYDLSQHVAGFDFFNWLVRVQAQGATGVSFYQRSVKDYKWPLDLTLRRYESILKPGCALAGMDYVIQGEGSYNGGPHTRDLMAFLAAGGKFRRLQSVLPPGKERYTVTLRNTQRVAYRNSREDDWRTFAAEIGALVIEDYDVKPIGLHERVALYAGAEMNFFVTNGPGGLCSLTPYPMMMFDLDIALGPAGKHGLKFGENYPWAGPDQYMIWEEGRLPIIRRHFEAWLKRKRAGSAPVQKAA